MKRALPWIINVALLSLLAIAVALVLGATDGDGDGDGDDEGIPTTTTTTVPKTDDFISDGPQAENLRSKITDDNLDLSAWDPDDWELSEVRTVEAEAMSVRSGQGVVLIYESSGCEDRYDLPDGYFQALYDPGDWVLWNTRGDDTRVCEDEIVLVKEK